MTQPQTLINRALGAIERAGNALPHPAALFLIFALLVIVLSDIATRFGLSVTHPGTGQQIEPFSLLTLPGLHMILTKMVTNFTGFAPLGTVLVALLGIGVAEGTGLIGAALRLIVLSAPKKLLTVVIVFAGVLSNTGGEVGYVLLVPLAATIFLAAGRHPMTGLAAAFAGVSGGYSANLLLGTIDPLLSGLTQEAAQIIDSSWMVNPACNYYFMAASVPLITLVGTLVTEGIVAKRFGDYTGEGAADPLRELSAAERRGLWFAFFTVIALAALLLWGTVPADGFLRNPKDGDLLHSPFLSGIVAIIFLTGSLSGIAYGIGARTVRSEADVMKAMSKSMETMGAYLVLVFFAAQFVAYFNWTNLGLIFAVEGAQVLKAANFTGLPLIVSFIFLTSFINLVMGSASAKWAVMAPVFVPMFMLLGYTPELTQVAFRVGDSVTNIISPMMSYFALIAAYIQRYNKDAGIGTLIAAMLPYSVAFFIVWTIMLAVWYATGWPLGPGTLMHLPR
ncbi:MAG: AbgT family transporter [Bryobacteraceae bacterium]|nr:AbgT family transporter [Bryobacteraceae bacterium]